MTVLRFT